MLVELLVPPEVARWISPQPWLQVHNARPSQARLRLDNREYRLNLVKGRPGLTAKALLSIAESTAEGAAGEPVIYGSYLSSTVREDLEKEGTSYIDGRGHLHLIAPGLLVHIDRASVPRKPTEPGRLGVDGVRTTQVLLEEQGPVSVSRLAERAGVSVGQAHKVLSLLEKLGFARTTGKGPARRRIISDRTGILDWLEQQPSAKRKERQLDVALYARRPEELWLRVSGRLKEADIPHALTGAAAASLHGVGPTSVPRSLVRISPDIPLDYAAKCLGAEITERGPNLTLMSDGGKVGCWDAVRRGDIQLAPAVRIYLDAQTERRGEDVARQFREVVLGY